MGAPSRLDELTERARRIITAGVASGATPVVEPRPAPSPHQGTIGTAADSVRAPSPPLPVQGSGMGPSVIVLGVDPGTATMGYGLVRALSDGSGRYEAIDYGVFETPAGEPMHQRLWYLYDRLRTVIRTHRPEEASVEKLFFGRNTTTALTVGQARGVALLAIAEANLSVAEYSPAEVKFALSSYGRASKSDIQRMTQMLLRLSSPPKPDDAADALAIALCHAHSMRARALGIR